jgi:hypothetical protein
LYDTHFFSLNQCHNSTCTAAEEVTSIFSNSRYAVYVYV